MRRIEWLIAGGFVAIGLLCLSMAAEGWISGPMGWMMISMQITNGLFLLVFVLMVAAIFYALYRVFFRDGSTHILRCVACGKSVESNWNVCPHCGEAIERKKE